MRIRNTVRIRMNTYPWAWKWRRDGNTKVIFMLRISENWKRNHVGSETGSGSVQNHSGSRATQCPDPDESYPWAWRRDWNTKVIFMLRISEKIPVESETGSGSGSGWTYPWDGRRAPAASPSPRTSLWDPPASWTASPQIPGLKKETKLNNKSYKYKWKFEIRIWTLLIPYGTCLLVVQASNLSTR